MAQRTRDALRKVYGQMNPEDFDRQVEQLLNNPGQFTTPNDVLLKEFLIKTAVEKLRMRKEGRNQRLPEQRRWLTLCIRYLKPMFSGEPTCADERTVLRVLIEGKDDSLLYELLYANYSEFMKVLGKDFHGSSPGNSDKLTSRQCDEIADIRNVAWRDWNAIRWSTEIVPRLKNLLKAELLIGTSSEAENANLADLPRNSGQYETVASRNRTSRRGILEGLQQIAEDTRNTDYWLHDKAKQYVREYEVMLKNLKTLRTVVWDLGIIFGFWSLAVIGIYFGGLGLSEFLISVSSVLWYLLCFALIVSVGLWLFWLVHTASWGNVKLDELLSSQSVPYQENS